MVAINALKVSEATNLIKNLETCTTSNSYGLTSFTEGNIIYCVSAIRSNGVRMTSAYRLLDTDHISVTMLSTRTSENYNAEKQNLANLVNSYKLQ